MFNFYIKRFEVRLAEFWPEISLSFFEHLKKACYIEKDITYHLLWCLCPNAWRPSDYVPVQCFKSKPKLEGHGVAF